ncbi:MAG TPA: 4'-phosphopantetheinyl transferase superfamily protein [Gemmatimonadales bacterium]|nr:4'-phosphopantetheinyl transferase superfamily protein [Gemmatimonadales bacterium]
MVEILVTPLDAGPAGDDAVTLLSGDERLRASRFAGPRARRRFAVARAELRKQLGARLEVPPQSIEFAYGPQGKPRLAGRHQHTGLRFSVSHCDGVAALAFATGGEVGVDIEALRAVPEADQIAAQLCTPAEWDAYEALAEHQRPRGFLSWWTRKEAFVKAHGGGLGHPPDAFDAAVVEFIPGPRLVGAVAFAPADDAHVIVHPLGIADGD